MGKWHNNLTLKSAVVSTWRPSGLHCTPPPPSCRPLVLYNIIILHWNLPWSAHDDRRDSIVTPPLPSRRPLILYNIITLHWNLPWWAHDDRRDSIVPHTVPLTPRRSCMSSLVALWTTPIVKLEKKPYRMF